MEATSAWDRWYRRRGKALLDDLERRRKAAVRDFWIACVVLLGVGVLAFSQTELGQAQLDGMPLVYLAPVMAPLVFMLVASVAQSWFQHQYKSELMPKLIRRLGGRFTYRARGKVAREAYDRSRLFFRPVATAGYRGEDLLEGEVGGNPLTMSELSISVPSGDSTITIFQGLFIHAPLQDFAGVELTVMRNNWVSMMHRFDGEPEGLWPSLAFGGAFGSRFHVRGTPQADAERLLTPEFQGRLLAFASQSLTLGKSERKQKPMADWQYAFHVESFDPEPTLALSVIDNRLSIAIQVGRDLFDPKLFKPANDPETVKRYMECLELLIGVLGTLGFVAEDEPEPVAS